MIISHPGAINELVQFSRLYSGKRILVVSGKQSFKKSGAKEVLKNHLKDEEVIYYSDFSPNPKLNEAVYGSQYAREFGVQVIIAVGGGSVIDMAKVIKALLASPDYDPLHVARGQIKVPYVDIPTIAIPTTAGPGSEATHFAVVYVGNEKYSLADPILKPTATILDGRLIATANNYQLACNALDAMSQAIESAWACGSTAESRNFAFSALRRAWHMIPGLIAGPRTEDKLQQLLLAANEAGRAIDISKTTAPHAWSYAITSLYGIPHGHAVWLTLPKIYALNLSANDSDVTDSRGALFFNKIMLEISALLGLDTTGNVRKQLQDWMGLIGIEYDLDSLGIDNVQKRRVLERNVNIERLKNHPVDLVSKSNEIFKTSTLRPRAV